MKTEAKLKTYQYPIVGAVFRPPADTLLTVMPVGTKLQLIVEPFNQFDKNAIAVWTDLDQLLSDRPKIADALAKSRNTDWIGKKHFQLGYLPKAVAKYLKDLGFPAELPAEFTIPMASHLPHAKFEWAR